MPRAASPEVSPNGSMKTVVSRPVSRKADCPYHSTCITLLQSEAGLLRVLVSPTTHQRGRRRDQAGADRERECPVQARLEGARDQVREEELARDHRLVVRAQRAQRVRADEVLDRVVAEEGG